MSRRRPVVVGARNTVENVGNVSYETLDVFAEVIKWLATISSDGGTTA